VPHATESIRAPLIWLARAWFFPVFGPVSAQVPGPAARISGQIGSGIAG
jgi:hypothetical protein